LSFALAAVVCLFSALSYAELASSIPVSGSAYTYAYATLGEVVAWTIGWDLILEYGVSVAAIAVGWGANFNAFLETAFGVALPERFTTSLDEGGINIPAVVIVLLITLLLMRGVKETANLNTVMVFIKLGVLAMFIGLAFTAFNADNLQPFAPQGSGGVLTAAALIFFAYIGFDAVSTAAEECRNPQKDMPIGMMGSLAICTVMYIAVALVLTGMLPLGEIKGSAEPLAKAFTLLGMGWAAGIVAFGAVIATTAVLLVFQLGQARIFFSMARDGLLPSSFAAVHPRYRTPHLTTIWTGVAVALLSAFANLDVFVELTNIGTLFAFVLVSIGVLVLRYKDPGRPRPFRAPLVPFVPLAGIAICIYLMVNLPRATWVRFGIWLAIGMVIYFLYGYRKSRLARRPPGPPDFNPASGLPPSEVT
jgi:APA family basic amino acid/polyamine antiporter